MDITKNPFDGFNHELYKELLPFYNDAFVIARRLTGDIEQARDIVQETLYKVSTKNIEELPAVEKRRYLLTSVRRACLNHLKKDNHHRHYVEMQQMLENEHPEEYEESIYNNKKMYALVLSCIKDLSRANREFMELMIGNKMDTNQIAEQLNISVALAQTRKSRAKAELKRLIEEKGIDPKHYLTTSQIVLLIFWISDL